MNDISVAPEVYAIVHLSSQHTTSYISVCVYCKAWMSILG